MKVLNVSFNMLKKLNKNGEVLKNCSLSSMTTLKVGGIASYLVKISTLEGFIKVMMYIDSIKCPYFVIGNGSNILASDSGYCGVLIKLVGDFDRILIKDTEMECGAGVSLAKAYVFAREKHLSGFESGATIPASIGGATYMNASAHDFEMAKIIDYVVAYHQGKITYLKNSDCEFGYRKSIFQNNEYIILRVGFKLIKDSQENIMNRHDESLQKRLDTQPLQYPNAGCIFKRIDGLNVSKMLDDMGCKGYSVGGAEVSKKHANFIINNHATSLDIKNLIEKIKEQFYLKYNIKLMEEINYLGEFDEINR